MCSYGGSDRVFPDHASSQRCEGLSTRRVEADAAGTHSGVHAKQRERGRDLCAHRRDGREGGASDGGVARGHEESDRRVVRARAGEEHADGTRRGVPPHPEHVGERRLDADGARGSHALSRDEAEEGGGAGGRGGGGVHVRHLGLLAADGQSLQHGADRRGVTDHRARVAGAAGARCRACGVGGRPQAAGACDHLAACEEGGHGALGVRAPGASGRNARAAGHAIPHAPRDQLLPVGDVLRREDSRRHHGGEAPDPAEPSLQQPVASGAVYQGDGSRGNEQ